MHFPLTQWTLYGESLPERLFDAPKTPSFSLPGADALSAFSDLIGEDEEEKKSSNMTAENEGVFYALCGPFEEDIQGEISLTREIDFGALSGDRALITFAHLLGSGEILLDDTCIARFGGDSQENLRKASDLTGMPCSLCVDVTNALLLGRRQTLSIRFDASRPAGVVGAAFLSVTSRANLSRVSIVPDALRRTMTIRARVSAQHAGQYTIRVQAIPGAAGAALPPARETDIELAAGEEKSIRFSMEVDADTFIPGKAYDAPGMKIQLFAKENQKNSLLCDDALLLCGYGPAVPGCWLPLSKEDCLGDPKVICDRLREMGIFAVSLPAPAPDKLYVEMTRSGVAVIQHVSEEIRPLFTRYPCMTLSDAPLQEEAPSLAAAVWQMTGSVAFPRTIDDTMTPEELLLEASGRTLDGDSQGVCEALTWLRAVQIRLRAEAARQGRYRGALCAAEETQNRDVCDALHTAFSPVHLSALPLSGAWWTGTRFSASLEVFIPQALLAQGEIQALAVLEDDDGKELARFTAPAKRSGYVGVIEAMLPDTPCVLTLHCALLCGGETLEENMLPVYVGDLGPLEAAFA